MPLGRSKYRYWGNWELCCRVALLSTIPIMQRWSTHTSINEWRFFYNSQLSHWRIPLVLRPLHATPKKFTALFLRLGLPSTLIRRENAAFRKHSWGIWKRWLCVLVWTQNILENGVFRKCWCHDNHDISMSKFSSNPKWPVIVAFSNFSGVPWTGPLFQDAFFPKAVTDDLPIQF